MKPKKDKLRQMTAIHEAGHAVMRRVCGLPATNMFVSDGDGYCEGTNQKIGLADNLRVLLAGVAAELEYRLASVDLKRSSTVDLQEARGMIQRNPVLRIGLSVDEAVLDWLEECCSILQPRHDLVMAVASAAECGYLSAESLQTIFEKFEQDIDNK